MVTCYKYKSDLIDVDPQIQFCLLYPRRIHFLIFVIHFLLRILFCLKKYTVLAIDNALVVLATAFYFCFWD